MQELMDSTKRITGTKQVLRALEQGSLSLVYIALDADHKLLESIKTACGQNDVPVKTVPTMNELGKACCIEVKAATAGILKQT